MIETQFSVVDADNFKGKGKGMLESYHLQSATNTPHGISNTGILRVTEGANNKVWQEWLPEDATGKPIWVRFFDGEKWGVWR